MPSLPAVHPLAPRFAQAITGVLCLEAVVFGTPLAVVVALVLVLLSLAGPRWSPVAWLFRRIAPPPGELEPAAPVRFSQVLAAIFLTLALALLALGLDVAGWVVVGHGLRDRADLGDQRLLHRLRGLPRSCWPPAAAVRATSAPTSGSTGAGPWLVVLTAPGCARCEPVARALQSAAGEREVVRVNLAEHPRAAALPVRSVPAAMVVGADGRLRVARAGRLGVTRVRPGARRALSFRRRPGRRRAARVAGARGHGSILHRPRHGRNPGPCPEPFPLRGQST